MKLRPPAVPLITVDPYFSVWSAADRLTDTPTAHWTGKPNSLLGVAKIDGVPFRFMGAETEKEEIPAMEQISLEVEALSTTYQFQAAGIELTARFLSTLFPEDYEHLTRPVSYLEISWRPCDQQHHQVEIMVQASEELCLDTRGQMPVETQCLSLGQGIACAKMGGTKQEILARKGDDLRIDWGYFYLAVQNGSVSVRKDDMTWVQAAASLEAEKSALFAFAYDDVESIAYFHQNLRSYWNREGKSICTAIEEAYGDFAACKARAAFFHQRLFAQAVEAGGEQYAQLLALAFRQVLAAHKLVIGPDGELLYISKECFSNGCSATVDISYPSSPLFLYYNPELIKGMMRPIFRYAASGDWPFAFAPHDVGTYPHLNGQTYSNGTDPKDQMPVEECGNMLIMAAALSVVEGNAAFAGENLALLTQWAGYLEAHGLDPENQLCTDDFAGHLAHNCNLSLKSIMALEGMSIILTLLGKDGGAYHRAAKEMAEQWLPMAANGDGSFRLAFDRPGTFSMKYNIIWDKLFGTGLFPKEAIAAEFASYQKHITPYGMPLDNRETYTKSDWQVWTASLAETKEDFMAFIEPLWRAYHETPSRVPMSDWYQTTDARQVSFQNRTVQGGLFLKLLAESGKCRWNWSVFR